MLEQRIHHFLSNDLQKIALQVATAIHRDVFNRYNFDMSIISRDKVPRVKQAYERAESWVGIKCPHCWIKDGQNFLLDVVAIRDKEDLFHCKCKTCNFEYHYLHPRKYGMVN